MSGKTYENLSAGFMFAASGALLGQMTRLPPTPSTTLVVIVCLVLMAEAVHAVWRNSK